MTPKSRRLITVVLGLAALGGAAGLVLSALNDNIVFFYGPSDLRAMETMPERAIRIGGLVANGSVSRDADGRTVRFVITDGAESVPVVFGGLLPDLFREGQGVIAQGRMENGQFQANDVLAKHDETYMPPEVADALKKAGHWQGDAAATTLNDLP